MTLVRPRSLTKKGIGKFEEFIRSSSTGNPEPYVQDLLSKDEYSKELKSEPCVPSSPNSGDRWELAHTLDELCKKSKVNDIGIDMGFWTWLSWHWLEDLHESGKKLPKVESATLIADGHPRRYYRHYLLGAWFLIQLHGIDPSVKFLLKTKSGLLYKPGEAHGQLASNQRISTSISLLRLGTQLYFDEVSQSLKVGAASKSGGTLRRFGVVISQLAVNNDVYCMNENEIIQLLPKEFEKFKPQ